MSGSTINDYRDEIYSTYYSAHMKTLHGETTINDIVKQFSAWNYYYGHCLPANKEARILEIGCGNGGFVYWLQCLGYKNVHGIDISPEQVEVAGNVGIKNIIHADLREFLPGREKTYDVIFARDVIEHFRKEEVLDTLRMIHKSLKAGGIFTAQTPNGVSPFSGRHRYKDFTHELIFTVDSFSQILKTSGFGDAGFYSAPPVPKGPVSIIRFSLWKIIETALRFYMAVETGSFSGVFTQNLIAVAKK